MVHALESWDEPKLMYRNLNLNALKEILNGPAAIYFLFQFALSFSSSTKRALWFQADFTLVYKFSIYSKKYNVVLFLFQPKIQIVNASNVE